MQSVIEAEDSTVEKKSAGITTTYTSDLTIGTRSSYGKGYVENLSEKSRDVIAKYSQQSALLDNSVKNDIQSIEELLGGIKGSGLDEEFGKYLDSIFEKGKYWEFIPHPENYLEYRVAFRNGIPRFLTGLGDGIKYAMRIIGTALIADDKGIFIEEIESNQHPASLRKLISFLIETAFRNNLQLFVTTHNEPVLRNIIYHFRPEEGKLDKRAKDVNVFHVQREDKTGIVRCEPIDIYYSEDYKKLTGDIY
ncbi:MAG: ATP/GTP-binding protein [Candidatus Hodarchaeota archaeon]